MKICSRCVCPRYVSGPPPPLVAKREKTTQQNPGAQAGPDRDSESKLKVKFNELLHHFSLTFGMSYLCFADHAKGWGKSIFFFKEIRLYFKGINQLITADFKYQAHFSCRNHMRFTWRMTRSLLRG